MTAARLWGVVALGCATLDLVVQLEGARVHPLGHECRRAVDRAWDAVFGRGPWARLGLVERVMTVRAASRRLARHRVRWMST